jgi:hypothetical protein
MTERGYIALIPFFEGQEGQPPSERDRWIFSKPTLFKRGKDTRIVEQLFEDLLERYWNLFLSCCRRVPEGARNSFLLSRCSFREDRSSAYT